MSQEQGLKQYFDAQMRLLMHAGKQFAQLYPEHASLLNLDSVKDRDPHIERLLEGVAYLTANIQKRLDESLPEISQQVLRQLCPILLDYYPSTTVVQFQPAVMLQKTEHLPKGIEITTQSELLDDACRFTTTVAGQLLPIVVSDVQYQESHLGAKLVVTLKKSVQAPLQDFDLSRLRFYLCGDTSLQSSLLQLMTKTSQAVQLVMPFTMAMQTKPTSLTAQVALLDAQSANLPTASLCHPAYSLLLDYFNGKERFYFVDVLGLDSQTLPSDCDSFQLEFHSVAKLPPGHRIGAEHLRLNCVPAINLFKAEAEPIRCDFRHTEYQVIVNAAARGKVFCHSILDVHSRSSATGQAIKLSSRYKAVFDDEQPIYSILSKDIGEMVPSSFIQIPVVDNADQLVLSTQVLASNAALPRQTVFEGDLSKLSQAQTGVQVVKNVILPSNFTKAPNQSRHWQLISLLNLKFSEITEIAQLQRLLRLFDWSGRSENLNRIKGLQAIQVKPLSIMKHGMFLRGMEVHLHIEESYFACIADVFHFANTLHHFFVMYAPINECVQSKVTCLPSQTEFNWAIATGLSENL
ncbi:type VI secretion system baseplate subunit TssF [Pseudoalteromonas fenneropenaei]|uniref:Type VI secretion system baseplate subunit TssF n=1 Tax=Pseudoalteromonas fenneropenaei TaxID=1737459 RepID=A0ABV7CI10_9GAMM